MARRNLVNVAERILFETIKLAGTEGIDKSPAKKIADNCDITDATIFVYYKTKENLLKSAYEYVLQKFAAYLKTQTAAFVSGKYKEVWKNLLWYAVENEYSTRYFSVYRHSSFYKDDDSEVYLGEKLSNIFSSAKIRCADDRQCAAFLEMMLNVFAETVIFDAEENPKNEKMLDALYNVTFGVLFN